MSRRRLHVGSSAQCAGPRNTGPTPEPVRPKFRARPDPVRAQALDGPLAPPERAGLGQCLWSLICMYIYYLAPLRCIYIYKWVNGGQTSASLGFGTCRPVPPTHPTRPRAPILSLFLSLSLSPLSRFSQTPWFSQTLGLSQTLPSLSWFSKAGSLKHSLPHPARLGRAGSKPQPSLLSLSLSLSLPFSLSPPLSLASLSRLAPGI